MSTQPNMLAMALLYGGAGVHVFPVNGKAPLTKNGFHDATTDRAQIEAWWTRWPSAGIATPDFDAVDVDLYKPECAATWARIKRLIPNETPHNRTGGGGLQFLFKAGTLRDGRIGPGIDSRYAGRNYVVLPPSPHPSGRRYEAVVSVLQRRPKPAPDFPRESGSNSEFKHLLGQMDEGEKVTQDRNKAAWWRAVEILRTLPASTDLSPVVSVVQSWVDANCDGNLADVHVPKQVRGAAKFVADERVEGGKPPKPQQADGPIFVDLREIEARDVEWLDKPLLPAGELVTNNADGDTGKGLLAAHWGARVSRGEFGDPRMVLFAVAEDAFDTILKPRLIAAGANFDHIRALSWRRSGTEDALLIPDDVPLLQEHIIEMAVRLLVIDPLLSHVSGKTNTHIDHEVKRALQPLMTLAHNTGCTVLGNGHFSKDKTGGARKAASASTAFTNTPRVGLAMAYDDEDPDIRVLEVIKSNLGPRGVGRNYRVKALELDGLAEPVPMLVAEGAATKSVDDLIAVQKKGKRIPSELVRSLILAELETGEKTRSQLDALALEKIGAGPDTVFKSGIGPLQKTGQIKSRKDGMNGPWCYRLALEAWAE